MGFIRGGAVILLGILLFLSLLIGNVVLVLSSSLTYDNVQKNLGPVMTEIVKGEIDLSNVDENFDFMKTYCEENDDFVLSQDEYVFVISCADILAGTPETVIASESEKFLAKIYYENYDCSFFDCLGQSETPFFLISEKSQNYFQNKFYYFLITSIILIGIMFVLIENKWNLPIVTGSLIAVASLPLKQLGFISAFTSSKYVSEFLSIFLSQAHKIFLIMLILGLVVLGVGIGLRIASHKIFQKK